MAMNNHANAGRRVRPTVAKLSKAQHEMLSNLYRGDLIRTDSLTCHWFRASDQRFHYTAKVSKATLESLRKAGYVEEIPAPPTEHSKSVFVHWFGISDTGRAALQVQL